VIIYPAIDIRGGRCVRLVEGDFSRETIFGDNPSEMALQWESHGATWIHIVDLDGARDGSPRNADAIRIVRDTVRCALQVGGGIRTEEDVATYLNAGIDRVVLGTAAIYDGPLVEKMVAKWGDRIAVGLDAREGKLAGSGWLDQTEVSAVSTAVRLQLRGVETFIYTDIAKDGTLIGPNVPEIHNMVSNLGQGLIASGGIGRISDITDIRRTGAEGVIIGRALYDARISLADALDASVN